MRLSAFFAVLALSSAPVALADTDASSQPSNADQSKVEASLKAHGYTQWKSIVLDKGTWEVDDAVDKNGKQFDLRIDAATMKIKSKVAE